MSLIYEPKGKAREYSPLALNIYANGCDHQCRYCYCPHIVKAWTETPTARSMTGLMRESRQASRQVLLSFLGDPYCRGEQMHRATREALRILKEARCSVAILTKGGERCLDDLATFANWPEGRLKVGATLTFIGAEKSREWEPGAASPQERIETLGTLHRAGVQTWASIEPVLEAEESLRAIRASLPHVDGYKIGKLNHYLSRTDWRAFCIAAITMVREGGRKLYVKDDLRAFAPAGFLTAEESNPETMFLPDRPSRKIESRIMFAGV